MALQHLRSSTANKRPDPTAMADGQFAINTESISPGVFFKNSGGNLVKVGPVHIGTTAPNVSPAGQAGNSTGEFWLDTTAGAAELKLYDGSGWVTVGLPIAGGALTGNLTLNAQSDVRFADSDSSNWVAFQAPATIASNVTWTLPSADGTANQVLKTDGAGALSWTTITATTDKIEEGNTSAEVVDTGSDGHFKVLTEGTERARIDSSGNIAVGTTSANTAGYGGPVLGMYGASNAGGNIWLTSDATAAANRAGRIGFGTEGNTTNKEIVRVTGLTEGSTAANLGGALLISTKADGGALTERARIDSSGRLLVGTTTSVSQAGIQGLIQVEATSTNEASIKVKGNSNDVFPASIALSKSRGTSVGSNTAVQNGDGVGSIFFFAADGTDTASWCAEIAAFIDGAPGSNDVPGRLVFSTTADGAATPTERMRIDNSGSVILGQATKTGTAYLFTPSNTGAFGWVDRPTTSTGNPAGFYNSSGSSVGTITTSVSSTSYNTSSDYRLKENVTPVADGITRLQQLKPSRFNFIADPNTVVDGFIAHEVQTIVPEAITGEKDAVNDEGNPIYQGIDQSKLVPLLTAALQEAVARIEQLEATVATLESA